MTIWLQQTRRLPAGALLLLMTSATAAAAATGEELFIKRCAGCHMIGAGALVGPDLKDVGKRRSEEWLLRFLKSPKAMFEAGDAEAVALIKAFPVLMPDTQLSEPEAREVLAFIALRSTQTSTQSSPSTSASTSTAAVPAVGDGGPVVAAPAAAPPAPGDIAAAPPPSTEEGDGGPPSWQVGILVMALALTAWALVRPRRKQG